MKSSVKWRRPGKSQQVKIEHFFWLQMTEVYPDHLNKRETCKIDVDIFNRF